MRLRMPLEADRILMNGASPPRMGVEPVTLAASMECAVVMDTELPGREGPVPCTVFWAGAMLCVVAASTFRAAIEE